MEMKESTLHLFLQNEEEIVLSNVLNELHYEMKNSPQRH